MVEITRERTIPASAGTVWQVVADAHRLPEWYARAEKLEILEGEGLGRRQRMTSHWRGQDSEVDLVVTAFEPERRLEWRHEAERLGGRPAPRFAAETIVSITLEPRGSDATRVALTSRQTPADPDKEGALRSNAEYLGQMLDASLQRLDGVVTARVGR